MSVSMTQARVQLATMIAVRTQQPMCAIPEDDCCDSHEDVMSAPVDVCSIVDRLEMLEVA